MSIGPPSPNVALVTKLVAKPDEADAVSTFLADAVRLASQEQGTIAWFALRTDTTTFWIVDAFPSEGERHPPYRRQSECVSSRDFLTRATQLGYWHESRQRMGMRHPRTLHAAHRSSIQRLRTKR